VVVPVEAAAADGTSLGAGFCQTKQSCSGKGRDFTPGFFALQIRYKQLTTSACMARNLLLVNAR
jgi:hypothetical protein